MSELKPCPFCGATDDELKSVGKFGHFIECSQCGTLGPDGRSKGSAAHLWNDCAARSSAPAKTLRDEFAMAALTGLLARMKPNAIYTYEDLVAHAYAIADAIMKEREKADD